MVYTSTGDIKRVILKPSDRRELTQYEDEEDVDEQGSSESYEYYYCDDCADTWDAVCDEGVPSVCRLVGFGSPFSAEASAAIEVVCNTFGEACSGSTGKEACEGQCGGDGNYDKGDDDDGDEGAEEGEVPLCIMEKHALTTALHFSTRARHNYFVHIMFMPFGACASLVSGGDC